MLIQSYLHTRFAKAKGVRGAELNDSDARISRTVLIRAMSRLQKTEADVLVIGSGAAGLYAALCAAKQHQQVVLITSSDLKMSSSAWAQGGIAAAISPDDSPEFHLKDTLEAGRGLCNRRAVEILTQAAPHCIREMELLGVAFDQDGADLALGREGGHSRRRILHAGGSATGAYLIRALSQRVQ